MKIIALGDFHGKFPQKLENQIKKQKPNLIISLGDFPSFILKKEFFKYCYKNPEIELWEVVGKKRFKQSTLKDLENGEKIIKKLNKLPFQILTVLGNYDHPADDALDNKKSISEKSWKILGKKENYFQKLIKKYKNIKYLDYKAIKINEFVFIGARGSSFPGYVKSKAYKKHRAILEKLFKKYKKEKIIFITHNAPYNTKIDEITDKNAPKIARGKHYGSKMFQRIIKKYQPLLTISGHFHEHQKKDKIKNTTLINPGPAFENKAVIINLDENKKKIKNIKFIK